MLTSGATTSAAGKYRWTDRLRAAVEALRPYQWIKNFLVLVPFLAAGNLADVSAWRRALTVLVAFCAMSSAVYLLNDMGDLAADRAHPRKRERPFASGRLPLAAGLAMLPLLVATGGALVILGGAPFALIAYATLSLAYTLKLKELPLVDVFLLAALYTIRMYGGGEASGYAVSTWLLGFSGFLFLSLALIKRVSELSRVRTPNWTYAAARRGYYVEDLPILQTFGIAATFASSVVLALYVQSEAASNLYHRPGILFGLVPLLVFWQCRLWLSTARGYMHDDPIVFAARDWVSWCVFFATAGVVVAAKVPL
jgi:4-hydroxybenzoate polyprenyltransferase